MWSNSLGNRSRITGTLTLKAELISQNSQSGLKISRTKCRFYPNKISWFRVCDTDTEYPVHEIIMSDVDERRNLCNKKNQ